MKKMDRKNISSLKELMAFILQDLSKPVNDRYIMYIAHFALLCTAEPKCAWSRF